MPVSFNGLLFLVLLLSLLSRLHDLVLATDRLVLPLELFLDFLDRLRLRLFAFVALLDLVLATASGGGISLSFFLEVFSLAPRSDLRRVPSPLLAFLSLSGVASSAAAAAAPAAASAPLAAEP